VAPGREWPILLVTDYNHERSNAEVALPIPFRVIARGSWVFEVHDDLVGSAVDACVEL
jgi:hypothetical protein